jgi:hypothetical protein
LIGGGTTLTYDPSGRLHQTFTATFRITQLVYDSEHVIAEYNGSTGAVQSRFLWGPGANEPIMQDEGSAMTCSWSRSLQLNDLGSVVAVSDCCDNRTNVNTYDECGIPRSGNRGQFQYIGKAFILDVGMYCYKSRF